MTSLTLFEGHFFSTWGGLLLRVQTISMIRDVS